MNLTHSKKFPNVCKWESCAYSNAHFRLVCSEMFFLVLLIGNFDLIKFWHTCGGPQRVGPCSAEHVRTFLNPAVGFWNKIFWGARNLAFVWWHYNILMKLPIGCTDYSCICFDICLHIAEELMLSECPLKRLFSLHVGKVLEYFLNFKVGQQL